MSKTVEIKSAEQFNALLKSSRVVVADCEFTLHPPSIMDGIGYTPPSSRRPPPPAACRGLPSMRRDDGPTRFQSFFFSFLFAYHIFTSCKQPLTSFFYSLRRLVPAMQANRAILRKALPIPIPTEHRHLRQDRRRS